VAGHGLTGVLLVGGGSRRFGSAKALATLDGETLAARAWRMLGALTDDRVAVGKASLGLELPFPLRDDGTDVQAPLAGVVAGLRAAGSDLVVMAPVDMPLLGPGELRALADGCGRLVAFPQTGPLPCALRRDALPTLERELAAGRLALRDAFAQLPGDVVPLDLDALVNVNTPADLARLELRLIPFHAEHTAGFRALVSDTLAEFGFTADPDLDPDLADPADVYEALWVAVRGERVAGSVAFRRLGPDAAELKRMYLRPEERGRGLGQRLLDTALLWAREHGIRTVTLDTTERMVAALRLYERYGFVHVDGDAPRQGQSRMLYELRL